MAPTNQRQASIVFSIDGANQSRQEVGKVRQAFEDFGDEGKKAAQKVADATDAIQRGVDRVEKKITQGKEITVRDVGQMRVNFERLGEAIEQTFGSVSEAPKDVQQAFKLAGEQIERVRTEAVKTAKAMQDTKAVTNETAGTWRGLGTEVKEASGKFGAVAGQIGLAFTALSEGWKIGTGVAKALGTDFTAMNEAMAGLLDKTKQVNQAYLDWQTGPGSFAQFRASITLTKAEFEGLTSAQFAGIKGIEDYKGKLEELRIISAANNKLLEEGTEGYQLASQAKKEANGVLENYIRTLDLATQASDVHHKLMEKGTEGQRLWNEIKEKGKGTLLDLAVAMKEFEGSISSVVAMTQQQVAAEEKLHAALNNTSAIMEKRLAMETQQAALVTQQEKVEDGLTESLRTKFAEITASLQVTEGKAIPLTREQIGQAEALLKSTIGLTQAQREQLETLLTQAKAANDANDAERKKIAALIEAKLLIDTTVRSTAELTAANMKWSDSSRSGKLTADEAAAAMKNLRDTGIVPAGEGMKGLVDDIDAAATNMDKLRTAAEATMAIMSQLGVVARATGSALTDASQAGLEGDD